jgi:hypothetical protein
VSEECTSPMCTLQFPRVLFQFFPTLLPQTCASPLRVFASGRILSPADAAIC